MKNFVAMMVSTGDTHFNKGQWYVVSPYSNPLTGEIDFDFYELERYLEAVNSGLKVGRDEKKKKKKKELPTYETSIEVGRI